MIKVHGRQNETNTKKEGGTNAIRQQPLANGVQIRDFSPDKASRGGWKSVAPTLKQFFIRKPHLQFISVAEPHFLKI